MEQIYLTKDEKSWIIIDKLPENLITYASENFDILFALHPEELGKVMRFDFKNEEHTVAPCARWFKSYMNTPKFSADVKKSYMFALPEDTLEKELPDEFKPFMQKEYNQATINWYNPDGYIPAHCDCDSGMIKDYKIMVINICESGSTPRNFHIKARNDNCLYQNLDIPLENGTVITMCGNMQDDYAHGVKTGDSRRISITFRQF